MDLERVK
jgi:hypothetical protein